MQTDPEMLMDLKSDGLQGIQRIRRMHQSKFKLFYQLNILFVQLLLWRSDGHI